EDIVEAGTPVLGQQKAGRFAQATLGAVALNGAADPLGGGETGADQGTLVARPRLDQHGAAGERRGLRARQELGALLQALDPDGRDVRDGVGHADTLAAIRRSGACGPWRGGGPAPSGRFWSTCAAGTHAGAYARGARADRSASRGGSGSKIERRWIVEGAGGVNLR